ncbi:hypothetical protein PENARI_c049G12079 [Penicillium arizonense]|uniref:Uncharacterized protein n=1 Tax=Penicillium arizonense TaxID=1835702 RepID=A0A1F5L2Y3_PENAI|nr:hypothetical protein PENARI_c049G12079 [Penicillium arizonense]OGE47339.1 hypothetical protein PENARI_c049G12079 [Penicillium arizonense]
MSKSSNQKRFQLRKQCREALAAHIFNRLHLVVAPERVRLQPRPGDGYAWSVTRANAALLKSNLSSGTINLYQKILKELGSSLEAVNPQSLGISQSNTCGLPKETQDFGEGIMDGSFTAEICELKAANGRMEVELERTRSRLDDSLRESHTLGAEANHLRHDMQILESQNKILRDKLVETRRVIAGAMQTLGSLQSEGIEIALDDTNDSQ